MELENSLLYDGYNLLYGEIITNDSYKLKHLKEFGFTPDVIFDLGANIGVFTRYAIDIYPNAKIISVEPHLENFSNLTHFTKSDNVVFINRAIGMGIIYKLELPNLHNGTHESYVNLDVNQEKVKINATEYWQDCEGEKFSIKCIMPDELINKYLKNGQKSYLKLDIEGNENIIWTHKESMEVLNKIDFIAMELHFLARNWTEKDIENTNKMMEYFSETHDCEFIAPMFYAKKR